MGRSWVCLIESMLSNTLVISSDCPSGPKEFWIIIEVSIQK